VGKPIREALAKCIVQPLIYDACRVVTSFRVIWKRPPNVDINSSWSSIYQQRSSCDEIIRSHPGVDFFFSAVSGLYNKTCRRADAWSFGITPAVSYFVVGASGGSLAVGLWERIQSTHKDVEVKTITSRRSPLDGGVLADDSTNVASPLFVVLKDYNSKYVRKQLDISHSVTESTGVRQTLTPPPIARLVVVNSSLSGVVREAYDAVMLEASSFHMDFDG